MDVILELKSDNQFSELLLKTVAIDDVWVLILFSIGITIMSVFHGNSDSIPWFIFTSYHLIGALILGVVIGYPLANSPVVLIGGNQCWLRRLD